jgi:hypothetical protein
MAGRQVIVTTVFGSGANHLEKTFTSFRRIPDTELHVFIYGEELPATPLPGLHYHLVKADPRYLSVRRDALFRRWVWPDQLDAEFALVVDGTDVICLQDLPRFDKILRGAKVAAATEWGKPIRIRGQDYTSTYINAGITFWNLPASREIRQEIARRGSAEYRGEYDDQTVINEVLHTKHFDDLIILPSQYNWRAAYRKNQRVGIPPVRFWPRRDCLDGVYLYHNAGCLDEVLRDIAVKAPLPRAALPEPTPDIHPLSDGQKLRRKLEHRWHHT